MLAATDHAVLELSAIMGDDVSDSSLLQLNSSVEVLAHYFIPEEVAKSLVQQLVLSADFHNLIDKAAVLLQVFGELVVHWLVWHIREHQDILE